MSVPMCVGVIRIGNDLAVGIFVAALDIQFNVALGTSRYCNWQYCVVVVQQLRLNTQRGPENQHDDDDE